jgi:hypothetical protein
MLKNRAGNSGRRETIWLRNNFLNFLSRFIPDKGCIFTGAKIGVNAFFSLAPRRNEGEEGRVRIHRMKPSRIEPLNLLAHRLLPLRSLRGRGPRCAKRTSIAGQLTRGGLGKPLNSPYETFAL